MTKYISQGKFQRVCEMPETELLIATKIYNKPELSMFHRCIRVEGTQEVAQTLIARHRGFYYFQYTDWNKQTRHYRAENLPSYLGFIVGISLLKQRGGYNSISRPLEGGHLFGARVVLE